MFVKKSKLSVLFVLCLTSVSGYAGAPQAKANPGTRSGQAGSASVAQVGPTCVSSDPDHICLAIKYVVYKDSGGQDLLTATEATDNLNGINRAWSQCNIAFQIDQFEAASPEAYGLSYNPANDGELPQIRSQFEDDSTLLVVTTGSWNRSGSLGSTGANAWTNMPGDSPLGAVLEQSVGTFPYIIAHEIGHYLNLLHVSDAKNLMNPIIYPDSDVLDASQCELARSTAQASWKKMLR